MHDVSAARALHAAEHGPEYMYSPEWTKLVYTRVPYFSITVYLSGRYLAKTNNRL